MATTIEPVERPWGHFYTVYRTPNIWVKTITIKAFSRLSLQVHRHREEQWSVLESGLSARIGDETLDLLPGVVYTVDYNQSHRIINGSSREKTLIEVALGAPDDNDIIRLQDDYGR